jgi:alginate O-acetyltransferase complex protein AlgI
MPAFKKVSDVVLCTALFPHLIAGPIVRLSHLTPQLTERERSWEDFSIGAARFIWGLAKKMLIADLCAQVADGGYGVPAFRLSQEAALWMVTAYAVQIYFDFSGYSDMAVGLARMLGFRFPENFHHPYAAVSMTDFWRRWHMSLSQWFRDYLFIPLGGSRMGSWKTYRNLAIVFLVTGAWHGAAWSFIVWGAVHGVLLMLERLTGLSQTESSGWSWLRRLYVVPLVVLTWVPFRAPDLESAKLVLMALFGQSKRVAVPLDVSLNLDAQTLCALAVGLLAFLMPRSLTAGLWLTQDSNSARWARTAVIALLLPLCLVQALSTGYSPFLYFQF